MDFDWSEDQRRVREEVAAFAARELNDDVVGRDDDHEFPAEAWKRCAAFGIQGLAVPAEYGGRGADPLTIAAAMEGLGYGCRDNGLVFSLGAQMWSCQTPIVTFGSEEQKTRYLPGLCDGSIVGVQAMTEPGSGSDAFSLTTRAERRDGGYILHGQKTLITNAPVADVFVVFASTDPGRAFAGISAFLVDRETPGLEVGPPFRKMGLHTSPLSELSFDGVDVPDSALLGSTGGGLAIFTNSMDWERTFILAGAVGTMERQLERAVAHARRRELFGQPIGKFQSVANRIVDMKLRLETSRLLLRRAAWMKAQGRSTAVESALVKLHLSECFLESSLDAVQVHGGYGYLTEHEIERDARDAVAGRIYSGTSEIQRTIVARALGL